jgi:hypothetical protein
MSNIISFFIELFGETLNHGSFNTKTKKGKRTVGILFTILFVLLIALIFLVF